MTAGVIRWGRDITICILHYADLKISCQRFSGEYNLFRDTMLVFTGMVSVMEIQCTHVYEYINCSSIGLHWLCVWGGCNLHSQFLSLS